MAYRCQHCNFKWNAWEDDFQKVLAHEKTHVGKMTDAPLQ